MRQIHKAIAVAFVALAMSGYTIRETKSNTDLDLYTSPSGTPAKAVSISGTSGFLAALFGTTVNTATLLTGAYGSSVFQADKTSNGTMMLHRESADSGGSTLELLKRRSGFNVVTSGDRIATLAFSAADGTAAREAAAVIAEVDGTPGASDMPGRLLFRTTADGAASSTERMRISNGGQVLLASVVGANLQLDENTTDSTPQINVTQTSTGDAGIGFVISGSTAWNLGVDNSDSDAFVIGDNGGGNIGSDATLRLGTDGWVDHYGGTGGTTAGMTIGKAMGGNAPVLFFAAAGGVACDTTCDTEPATVDADSGLCLGAWDSNGNNISCASASGAHCLCAGRH
jgi:hypothetical protein